MAQPMPTEERKETIQDVLSRLQGKMTEKREILDKYKDDLIVLQANVALAQNEWFKAYIEFTNTKEAWHKNIINNQNKILEADKNKINQKESDIVPDVKIQNAPMNRKVEEPVKKVINDKHKKKVEESIITIEEEEEEHYDEVNEPTEKRENNIAN